MCQSQSDGGRRCAAHTRPAYRAAIDAILDEPDFTKKTAILRDNRDAVISYAATQSGSKDFTIESANLLADARRATERPGPVEAKTAAIWFEAAVQLAQEQAKVRTQVDTEVMRALKRSRTGTFTGPDPVECVTFNRDSFGLTIDPSDYAQAMSKGRYDSGDAETVDWCDEAQAHHGFARTQAPWMQEQQCLHCADVQIGNDEPPTYSAGTGSNVNERGYDMTPGRPPALTRM